MYYSNPTLTARVNFPKNTAVGKARQGKARQGKARQGKALWKSWGEDKLATVKNNES
jgi:hypothetical protein